MALTETVELKSSQVMGFGLYLENMSFLHFSFHSPRGELPLVQVFWEQGITFSLQATPCDWLFQLAAQPGSSALAELYLLVLKHSRTLTKVSFCLPSF